LGSGRGRTALYEEFGTDLIVYRLPRFDLDGDEVDKMMKRISGHKALVLDLRGNPVVKLPRSNASSVIFSTTR